MGARYTLTALAVLVLFSITFKGLLFPDPVLAYNLHNLLPLREAVRRLPAGETQSSGFRSQEIRNQKSEYRSLK